MIKLQVLDMTCGGCAGKVGRAIMAADDEAKFEIDLARRTVLVTTTVPVVEVCASLANAGFPATSQD